MKKLVFLIVVLLMGINLQMLAQEKGRAGKIGLGYSGLLTPATSTFNLTFWLGDLFVLEPQVGGHYVKVENIEGTNWRAGIAAIGCFSEKAVTPYLGVRLGADFLSGGGKTHMDLDVAIVFGGEYFVSEWFSTGVEMRLKYVKTDSEFSPIYSIANTTIVTTEQAINVKVYLR